jgi:hypothetical protein
MDPEQMELLERLARLRELRGISRREFRREKEAILRAPPLRPASAPLRALPAPGAAAPTLAVVSSPAPFPPPRPRLVRMEPEPTALERIGLVVGWILWTLFSIGGLDALLDPDPLLSLALLVAGLLVSPPFHRLLATRFALPTHVVITALGLLAALGIGATPPGQASSAVAPVPPAAASACGKAVSQVVEERGERARKGIARPWRRFWGDLVWARVAGHSLYRDWRNGRG